MSFPWNRPQKYDGENLDPYKPPPAWIVTAILKKTHAVRLICISTTALPRNLRQILWTQVLVYFEHKRNKLLRSINPVGPWFARINFYIRPPSIFSFVFPFLFRWTRKLFTSESTCLSTTPNSTTTRFIYYRHQRKLRPRIGWLWFLHDQFQLWFQQDQLIRLR